MSVLAPVRLSEAADSLVKASTPEPFSTSTTSNWVARAGGLPPYIQHIAHDLMEKRGKTESEAIGMAVGICQNWASGRGKVDANTQAAARKAIAEWEAKKAKAAADKAGKSVSKAAGKLGEGRIGLSERVALRTAASARLRVVEEAFGVDSMVALLEAKGAGFKPELKRVASASREKERYELHDAGQHVGTIASRTAYDPAKPDRWRASAVNGRQIGEETDSQGKALDAVRKHLEDAPARVVASPTEGRFLVGEPQSYSGTTNYKEFPSESSARFEAGLPEMKTRMEKMADVTALGEMIAFDVFTLSGLGEELPTGLTFLSEAVVLAEDFHGFDPAKHPRGVHGRFAIGDKVNFQHSYFGRVPASVTKVTSRRVFISSSDPRVKPTSMTHNQAAAKLSKTTGAAKKLDSTSEESVRKAIGGDGSKLKLEHGTKIEVLSNGNHMVTSASGMKTRTNHGPGESGKSSAARTAAASERVAIKNRERTAGQFPRVLAAKSPLPISNTKAPYQVEKGAGSEFHVRNVEHDGGKSLGMSENNAHERARELNVKHIAELQKRAPAGTVYSHTQAADGTHMISVGKKVRESDHGTVLGHLLDVRVQEAQLTPWRALLIPRTAETRRR